MQRQDKKRLLDNISPKEVLKEVLKLESKFNHYQYLEMNPDLEEMELTNHIDLTIHYLLEGHQAGRPAFNPHLVKLDELPENFDEEVYKFMNLDVAMNVKDVVGHFLNIGYGTNRTWNIGMNYEEMNKFLVEQDIEMADGSIVIVNHESTVSGAPFFAQDLANWLIGQGFENVVFLDAHPSKCFTLNKKIKHMYYFNNTNILLDILNMGNPSVIYNNSMTRMVTDYDIFAHLAEKTIYHFHETYVDAIRYFRGERKRMFQLIANAKAVFFVAKKIRDNFRLPPELIDKSYVVPEFVDDTRVKKIKKNKKRTKLNKRVKIAMCGTINARKNIRLFAETAKACPEYDFVWIGGKLDTLTIPNLEFIDMVKNPHEYLEKCDYFFLTSNRDPCPIVVLESLLMNHKIIVCENNIRYNHPVDELENYLVIKDHNFDFKKIIKKFKALDLNTKPQKTQKNKQYFEENFTYPHVVIPDSVNFMEFFE